ncbi:tetratricopeptide repeat protein [Sulfurimonas sp.]|jgi:Flp pilus assembly protein TadD|uniref:tetratricopeptide repeat protein n=1 Tax=Sulfurimonas sp. TaxID=2022749 RepID=UPI001BBA4138|nr:tetratricopeptide repeat protein [Sulfurimonas sp.]MBS4068349.1 tetratricopeptide repeat protein [Sulfurimonas sp.]MDD3855167.1 tetratricopeptide repeat protein [Sulfurimonas sp.]MDX9755894.1 tetratricopeptide repeat protein [Sulfurimonas sp.]
MGDGQEEEIIIIEDSDATSNTAASSESQTEEKSSANKKKFLYIGIGVGVVILLAVIAFFVIQKLQKKHAELPGIVEQKIEQDITEPVEPSKIENMIAKADYLYSTGSKDEALYLYEKIAHYSEAVSAYNLGVAQLKDAQYETALASFQKAIQNNEKRCVSAINAAVCSLHLNNEKNFKYYIDMAYAYLPQERPSPLYSYYYTLINYYNGNYLEALSSLNNPTTDEYIETQNSLSSKINALFDNNVDAIRSLEKNELSSNDFSLGLLYAKVGDLAQAKKYLQSAIQNNIEPMKAQLALGYIKLKTGEIQAGAKDIENATDIFAEKVYEPYPIQVKLKDSLFNQDLAQKRYRSLIVDSKLINYQKLFYFSPYKIFNANQTISYIMKGTANIFIDNVDSAQTYLKQGTLSSSVNAGIVTAIKKALSFKIREANEMLQKLVEIQPKHSILHYNLALTYAQMGNMVDANKHFLRSYNLDAKNYLSGIYAVMTSQLINKDSEKLSSIIKDSIMNEEFSEDIDFYTTLLHLSEDNILGTTDWLGKSYEQKPLYLALDVIVALKQNNVDAAQKSASKLIKLIPNEILPHLMYIDAYFGKLSPKEYANEVLNYLKIQNFDFKDLYFGAYVTRYLYVQQNLITGKLYFLREHVRKILESTTEPVHELTSTLALASLYEGAYEESYTLYNNLIDNLKVQDPQTLFLGAVASTAANHHENAIALLELSKMKDANFLESRYALGLLYLETKNNKGAVIQLSKINKNNFNSEYFNFDINTDKLMYEKSLSQK